jgi:hypothetical protein
VGGPCTAWVTVGELQTLPGATDIDAGVLADAIDVAGELLYRLSARQFPGVCNDVVRPLRREYSTDGTLGRWWWRDGILGHSCGYPPSRDCGCGPLPEITLGAYPIREIIEVRIDGAVLSPSAYRVDDRRWLVRIDGQAFPCCQRLDLDPLTDLDTFQVTFSWGQPPPAAGVAAVKIFALEIAKMLGGDQSCMLPQRLQNIVTAGGTYALLDPMTFLNDGLTGIYLVDAFIKAVNPNRLQRRSSVISPDIGRPVRRTAVAPGS